MPSGGALAMVARMLPFVTSVAEVGGSGAGLPVCSVASVITIAPVALVIRFSFVPSIFTEFCDRPGFLIACAVRRGGYCINPSDPKGPYAMLKLTAWVALAATCA